MPPNFTKHSCVERGAEKVPHTRQYNKHPSFCASGPLAYRHPGPSWPSGSLWVGPPHLALEKNTLPTTIEKRGSSLLPQILFFLHDEWCVCAHSLMCSLSLLLLILLEQMGGVGAASSVFDWLLTSILILECFSIFLSLVCGLNFKNKDKFHSAFCYNSKYSFFVLLCLNLYPVHVKDTIPKEFLLPYR